MSWPSTGKGQVARSCSLPACLRNLEGLTKAITVTIKKTTIGWTFKQLLSHIILGPAERKMRILPTNSSIQFHTQDVSPQYPRIFQTDLGSLDLSCRENMMEQTLGCFPWECGGVFPKLTQSGEIVTEKWPSSKHFQAMCYSQHTECWESYVPSMNERHQKRMWFQSSVYQELSRFSVVRTPGLHRGPNFQSHSQYISLHFLSLVNPFLALIGSALEETGLGNCLRVLSAILLLPWLVDILMEMILQQGVASCLLAPEIKKVWPNISMSQVGKHHLNGLSGSCQPTPF